MLLSSDDDLHVNKVMDEHDHPICMWWHSLHSEVACRKVTVVIEEGLTWVVTKCLMWEVVEEIDVWVRRKRIDFVGDSVCVAAVENALQLGTAVKCAGSNLRYLLKPCQQRSFQNGQFLQESANHTAKEILRHLIYVVCGGSMAWESLLWVNIRCKNG